MAEPHDSADHAAMAPMSERINGLRRQVLIVAEDAPRQMDLWRLLHLAAQALDMAWYTALSHEEKAETGG